MCRKLSGSWLQMAKVLGKGRRGHLHLCTRVSLCVFQWQHHCRLCGRMQFDMHAAVWHQVGGGGGKGNGVNVCLSRSRFSDCVLSLARLPWEMMLDDDV